MLSRIGRRYVNDFKHSYPVRAHNSIMISNVVRLQCTGSIDKSIVGVLDRMFDKSNCLAY